MSYLLILGDSIVNGYWDLKGGWAERLKKEIFKKNLEWDKDFYYLVYNLGVSGDTTTKLLSRFEDEVKARSGEEKFIFIFQIGLNDGQFFYKNKKPQVSLEQFEKNLQTLIEKARKYSTKIFFVGLTPVDETAAKKHKWWPESAYRYELVEKYDQRLKKICEEKKIGYVDLLTEFKKKGNKKLLLDGVHPNTEGHKLIFKTVKRFLNKNLFKKRI